MNDIELETLKNYARIIKANCINKEECKNCPFGKDTEGVDIGIVSCPNPSLILFLVIGRYK